MSEKKTDSKTLQSTVPLVLALSDGPKMGIPFQVGALMALDTMKLLDQVRIMSGCGQGNWVLGVLSHYRQSADNTVSMRHATFKVSESDDDNRSLLTVDSASSSTMTADDDDSQHVSRASNRRMRDFAHFMHNYCVSNIELSMLKHRFMSGRFLSTNAAPDFVQVIRSDYDMERKTTDFIHEQDRHGTACPIMLMSVAAQIKEIRTEMMPVSEKPPSSMQMAMCNVRGIGLSKMANSDSMHIRFGFFPCAGDVSWSMFLGRMSLTKAFGAASVPSTIRSLEPTTVSNASRMDPLAMKPLRLMDMEQKFSTHDDPRRLILIDSFTYTREFDDLDQLTKDALLGDIHNLEHTTNPKKDELLAMNNLVVRMSGITPHDGAYEKLVMGMLKSDHGLASMSSADYRSLVNWGFLQTIRCYSGKGDFDRSLLPYTTDTSVPATTTNESKQS